MYRLLAIAKYDERYVIPPAHAEQAHSPRGARHRVQPRLRRRAGHGRLRAVRRGLRRQPTPIAVENFQHAPDRQTADTSSTRPTRPSRVNLLNWDGKGAPGRPVPAGRRSRRDAGHATTATGRDAELAGATVTTHRRHARDRAGRRPRCCSATRTTALAAAAAAARAVARLPAAGRGARCARFVDHARADAARRSWPADYVATFDHRTALLPVPDLLRPRRHPQARRGAAAVQAGLPRGRPRARPTTSCPTTCASCSSSPRPRPRAGRQLLLDHRAGLELLRLACDDDAARRGADVLEAVAATLPAAARRRARRRRAGWPPQGPPAEEVGLTPFAAARVHARSRAGQRRR